MKGSNLVLNNDPEHSVPLVAPNYQHRIRQAVAVAADIEVADDRSDQIGSTGVRHNAYPNPGHFLEPNIYQEYNRIDQEIVWRMIARQLGVIF